MKNKLLALALATAVTGCASTPELMLDDGTSLMQSNKVYTQTNLHPDIAKHRLYSINYQQDGFIPRCTEVQLLAVNGKVLRFEADGQTYEYIYHKASGSFDANIKEYFSNTCNNDGEKKLNQMDKKGIKLGKVFKGMTKRGVIWAIGYPPRHKTPVLEADTWKYWSNRFNTFDVVFDENTKLVSKIVN